MTPPESAIDKVKKLLRLSRSDNPHESAAAIAHAQAIMDKHAITEAMLQDTPQADPEEEIKNWEDPLGPARATWTYRLAHALCKANGCYTYQSRAVGSNSRGFTRVINVRKIVGCASNVQKVRYLYGYCMLEIERLAKKHGKGNGRIWTNNFRIGCTDAIAEAIEAERLKTREEIRRQAEASAGALIRVNRAITRVDRQSTEAERWIKSRIRMGTAKTHRVSLDPSAREAGRNAGRSIYPGASHRRIGTSQRRLN